MGWRDTFKIVRRGPRGERFTQRGMALLFAAVIIAFVGVTATDFTYNTNVDFAQAANARDDMRAHFLARSGMNLSRIVIKVQTKIDKLLKDNNLPDMQLADYLPMLVGIFGGSQEEVNAFAEAVGGIDTSAIKGLGLPAGEFEIEVTTEDNKININCANDSKRAQQIFTMIGGMIAPVGYDLLFQSRDGDGQFTDRDVFAKALIDWVDADEAGFGASGQPEAYGYEERNPPYKARNAYVDSPDELQLVRGMDEKRWALFGKAFTAWGGCQINLTATSDLNLILSVLGYAADENDPLLREPAKMWVLAGVIAQARGWGLSFANEKEFVSFVADPMAKLAELMGTGADGKPVQIPGLPGGAIPKMTLREDLVRQVARFGARRTYRVVTTARIGKIEKRIIAVWDTNVQPQDFRAQGSGQKGAWVYWREE